MKHGKYSPQTGYLTVDPNERPCIHISREQIKVRKDGERMKKRLVATRTNYTFTTSVLVAPIGLDDWSPVTGVLALVADDW